MTHEDGVVGVSPFVDIIKREQQRFLTRLLIYEIALLHIGANEFIAPPSVVFVLRNDLVIVGTAIVEFFESEKFLLCLHRESEEGRVESEE